MSDEVANQKCRCGLPMATVKGQVHSARYCPHCEMPCSTVGCKRCLYQQKTPAE